MHAYLQNIFNIILINDMFIKVPSSDFLIKVQVRILVSISLSNPGLNLLLKSFAYKKFSALTLLFLLFQHIIETDKIVIQSLTSATVRSKFSIQ